MGCVCSRGEKEEEKSDFRSFTDEFSGIYGCGIQNFDSGELRMTPARAGTGKVCFFFTLIDSVDFIGCLLFWRILLFLMF